MRRFLIASVLVVSGGAVAVGVWLALRQWAYKRHLGYDPQQDCEECFSAPGVETVSISENVNGFVMPEIANSVTGGFLELNVSTRLLGALFDPSIDIEARGFHDVQYLERSVRGVRYFNVSRLLRSGILQGEEVTLRGRHLDWQRGSARLHLSRERL